MINRILTRLLKIPNRTIVRSFSSFDDSNKGGRGGSKFFGRKDKGKQISNEPDREEDRKETHHKTVKFMKKHELKMKDLEGQPKKELRFRKKNGFEQAETEKPSPFVRPLGEENEEEEIKKSIFFARTATPAPKQPQSTLKSFSLPQLKQFLISPAPESKFYDKLSHDLDNILLMFSRKNWKELSDFIQKSYSSIPEEYIEKELHSLLIATDASSYLQWIRSKGRNYKDLSEKTLRKLYNQLLRQQKHVQLKELLDFFLENGFNVEYRSADTVMFDLTKEAPLRGLEQQLGQKIDLAIYIFKVQKTFFLNQTEQKIQYEEVYSLGEWFNTLAYLALDRKIATRKFLALFDEIFSNHWQCISNDGVFGSGLFLRVISQHYFGTHITTSKVKQLFSGFIVQDTFLAQLVLFRNALAEYKRKTGKAPFPNAKNIIAQFNNAFEEEDEYECIFYFTLLNYNDQPIEDINLLLERREILLAVNGDNLKGKDVLNDLLFKLTPDELASRPVAPGEAEERERKRQERSEKARRLEMQAEMSQQDLKEDTVDETFQKIQEQHEGLLQEGDSQYYSWSLYEPIPDQKIYGTIDATSMGWSVSQYNNIYTYLSQQAAAEGNPYRKELLQNILRAKLNANKCRSVQLTPQQEDEAMYGSDDPLKPQDVPTQQELEDYKIEREALIQEILSIQPEDQEDDQPLTQDDRESIVKKIDNLLACEELENEEQQQFDSSETGEDQIIYDANELYRPTIEFNNTLAIKSAIKLGKLELAYGLCQKTIMEPLITERARKDIAYAVKAYLVEENSKLPITDLPNILESVEESVLKLSDEFLCSVYDRCDSFDQLIWGYTPPRKYKFDFWRATLALDRGHELIKMDISNKLKDMKYQPEYDTLPYREKDGYIKDRPTTWRIHLMSQLGIVKPAKIMDQQPVVVTVKSDEEFYANFIHEELYEDLDVEALEVEHGLRETELAAEGTEAAEEGIEASEAVENVQDSDEAEVEAAKQVQATEAVEATETVEAEKSAGLTAEEIEEQAQGEELFDEVEKQQPRFTIKVDQSLEKEQQSINEQQSSDDKKLDPIFGIYSNFDPTATTRIRGYDFTNFLTLAKTQIRPNAEKQYQQEKELKKFMINLESLCEESMVEDVHYLERKLHAYQKSVKSLTNIKLLLDFGIWNFEFSEACIDPQQARSAAKDFREKFYKFKTYNGAKGYGDVNEFSNERFLDIAERFEFITELKFTEEMVEDLLLRRFRLFKDAEATNKLPPSKEVQELLAWGLRHDQPMAIYLAEKIAMLTNQMIPHNLAKQVGNYLSHRRDVPSERIQLCKECLKIVGKINREHIYDFNKQYPHITVRKHFQQYLSKRSEQLNSTSLEFLSRVDPMHSHQPEPHVLRNNLKRSQLVV